MIRLLAISAIAFACSPVLAGETIHESGGSWVVTINGVEHRIPRDRDRDTAIAAARAAARAAANSPSVGAAKPDDIREFRGVVLSIGPDNNTGMVTASTRGQPVEMRVVYHDGQQALRWSPMDVRQLPTTQRVTPAEQFIRAAPASTTTTVPPVVKLCGT